MISGLAEQPWIGFVDVGHGACTVVRTAPNEGIVFDAPTGKSALSFLRSVGISCVKLLVVSHGDADHMAGILNLLTAEDIFVERILLNPEHRRSDSGGVVEKRVAKALEVAGRQGAKILTAATVDQWGSKVVDGVQIDILWPVGSASFAGIDGGYGGRRLSANSLSVVAVVSLGAELRVLLPGDIDAHIVRELIARETAYPFTKVMVLPHHGGSLGPEESTREAIGLLLGAFRPREVIGSFGRATDPANPRPEVIDALRASGGDITLRCTQLSQQCLRDEEFVDEFRGFVPDVFSRGHPTHCCAGTMVFAPGSPSPEWMSRHNARVRALPAAVCRPGSAPVEDEHESS